MKEVSMDENKGLEEGISLYNEKNYTDALSFFLSLPSDSYVDSIEVAYYAGLCYAKLNRYDDALLYLEQVVTTEGADTDERGARRVLQCRYLLAVIYCKTGRNKLADFELNKLIELGYKKASAYASLAYIAWQEDDVDKCIEYYQKALAEDEENPTALNGLGYVLANEERDLVKALNYCKRALALAPSSAACMDSVGWVYYKMGLYTEAKRYLAQAAQLDKDNELIAEHLLETLEMEGEK